MKRRTNRGIAFILALVVLVVAMMFVAASSVRLNQVMKEQIAVQDEARARTAAEAGIQRALAELSDFNTGVLNKESDTWASVGDSGNINFVLGSTSFRLQIVDAGAKVNLSGATEEQLEAMKLSDEQVESLLDWRTDGLQPRTLGAKDEFYNALTTPYNTKLRRLDTIDELLLIKGFNAKTLLNPPENTTASLATDGTEPALIEIANVDGQCGNVKADGAARTNLNTAQLGQLVQIGLAPQVANAIIQRRNQLGGTFTTLAQVLATPGITSESAAAILNDGTVTTDQVLYGKININAASEEVLNTIPNMTPALSSTIALQGGTFASLGALATTTGVALSDLQLIADYGTVGSQVMVVRSLGKSGSTTVAIEAVLDMTSQPYKVRRIQRVLAPNPIEYWGWAEETNQENILLESGS